MKYFKTICTLAISCVCILGATENVWCQKLGIKYGGGFSRLGSSHLRTSMESLKEDNTLLKESGANSGIGAHYSVGIFGEYAFSDVFSVVSDPSVNFTRSNIFITTVSEDLFEIDEVMHGYNRRIASKASFRFGYINVPIMAKYMFSYNRGIYALGGIGVNFIFRGRFRSDEKNTLTTYEYDAVKNTEISERAATAKISQFNPIRFDFVLGVGKTTRFLRRDMFMELRYNLPITRTSLFISDSYLAKNSFNNIIYSKHGRGEEISGNNLNNFNLSTLTFTVRYTIIRLSY